MEPVRIEGIAKGGDGIAREPSGRVVFVRGTVPGDLVEIEIRDERPRRARGIVRRVLEAGPGRVDPPCRHVGDGCGGCDFQHVEPRTQHRLKQTIVFDAFRRIGRFETVETVWGGAVAPGAYRTSVSCGVTGGRAGFRGYRSHHVVPTPDCLVVHPAIRDIITASDFGAAERVDIRVGSRTGETTVVAWPDADRCSGPAPVVGADEVRAGREVFLHEHAAGRAWRVSSRSFFQSCPEAVELLAAHVADALGPIPPDATLCDLYAGVGVFAGTVGHSGPIVAVEGSAASAADARTNLAGLDATVIHCGVERWKPRPAHAVIADPPRAGLGAAGADAIVATGASVGVLVSCDPAAGARDARLLVERGYRLGRLSVLDLFPGTSHVEVVAPFHRDRSSGPPGPSAGRKSEPTLDMAAPPNP